MNSRHRKRTMPGTPQRRRDQSPVTAGHASPVEAPGGMPSAPDWRNPPGSVDLVFVPDAFAPDPQSLTDLLRAAQDGDTAAHEAAASLVYRELHQLAEAYLGRERDDHTLQPTALVNEAYLRLLGHESPWENRAQFFGIAGRTMRRILVDHARRRMADRRDARLTVTLEDAAPATPAGFLEVLEVHDALERLEQLDPRQAHIVELKFFVGLSLDEIAEALSISPATVSREWALARRWLRLHALKS